MTLFPWVSEDTGKDVNVDCNSIRYNPAFILHRAIPVTSVVGYARKKETRFIVGTIPR